MRSDLSKTSLLGNASSVHKFNSSFKLHVIDINQYSCTPQKLCFHWTLIICCCIALFRVWEHCCVVRSLVLSTSPTLICRFTRLVHTFSDSYIRMFICSYSFTCSLFSSEQNLLLLFKNLVVTSLINLARKSVIINCF